jgi:hypothetical protein
VIKHAFRSLQKSSEAVAVVVAVLTLLGVIVATQYQPPDTVTLNAKRVSSVSVSGSATGNMLAYAKSLLLTDASGQVDLVLPVAATECGVLHDQANVTCDASGAEVAQSISAMWSTPRQLEVPSAAGSEIVLSTLPEQSGGGVSFSVTGAQTLRLCIGQAAAVPLSLRIGSAEVNFPVSKAVATCSGLVVSFRSKAANPTSGFIVRGLADTTTTLHGKHLTLSADAIRLTSHSAATDSSYDGGLMEVESDQLFGFTATGAPPDLVAKDQVVNQATKVAEAGVDRRANAYSHYAWISYLITLMGALATFSIARLGSRTRRRAEA